MATNVELAREVLDALGRRDPERLLALSEPHVEWHSLFAIGQEGGVYRGASGTERYMRDLDEAMEIGDAVVDEALNVGNLAVLVGHIHYRGKGSGADATTPVGWVLKFRRGRLVRFRALRDPEKVFEAISSENAGSS